MIQTFIYNQVVYSRHYIQILKSFYDNIPLVSTDEISIGNPMPAVYNDEIRIGNLMPIPI